MLNDIYNKRIIELAGNIPRLGRLSAPDATATAHSKLCGSTVKIDLKMDGDTVTDFAHDVKACALGQASSSIMASHVVGSTASELRELRETVRKMLKENGAPPEGKWEEIKFLEPVRDYKARARLDASDLRCRGRCHRPDRGQDQAAGCSAGLNTPPSFRASRSDAPGTRRLRGFEDSQVCAFGAETSVETSEVTFVRRAEAGTVPVGTRASAVLRRFGRRRLLRFLAPNLSCVLGESSAT